MIRIRLRWLVLVGCWFSMALAWEAQAQEPITNNDFNLDAVNGPVLGSSRVVGMAGAYTALATDISGASWNPASFGSRPKFELDWFEWDLSLSLFSPGLFEMDDFFNNGSGITVDLFLFVTFGFRLQFGEFGMGGNIQSESFRTQSNGETIEISLLSGHYGIAYGFFAGQLVLGLGARSAGLEFKLLPEYDNLVKFEGSGPEFGAILKLADQPWRFGITARLPVESSNQQDNEEDGIKKVRGYVLPDKVFMPWEIQIGLAWQFGSRPLNQRWFKASDPKSEMEQALLKRRCQRMLLQVRLENQKQAQPAPKNLKCPRLNQKPQNADWWAQEKDRRSVEDQTFRQDLEKAYATIEKDRIKHYQELSREYYLISADVLLIGTTPHGVSADGFVEQVKRRSGTDLTIGFRLGFETEPVPHWLKVRAGTYLEAPRSPYSDWRLHATLGLDARMFSWDLFGWLNRFTTKASLVVDLAKNYLDIGLGISIWH